MKRAFDQIFVVIFMTLLLFSVGGCGENDPSKMSPMEVINLYYKARNKGDIETLLKIIYFPPAISAEQRKAKAKSLLSGGDEKGMMKLARTKINAEYEEIINDDTAEVGVVLWGGIPGFKKRIPFQQVILIRENSVWKYVKSKYELTEDELVTIIRENPYDASAIYHLGRKYQPENSAKANRYFRKYYELEPKGFWISKEFLLNLNKNKDFRKIEIELLQKLPNTPERSPRRAGIYRTLGQYFSEYGDYEKARDYFDKAEKILALSPGENSFANERLRIAKKAFESAMANKSTDVDILRELEAQGVYK